MTGTNVKTNKYVAFCKYMAFCHMAFNHVAFCHVAFCHIAFNHVAFCHIAFNHMAFCQMAFFDVASRQDNQNFILMAQVTAALAGLSPQGNVTLFSHCEQL